MNDWIQEILALKKEKDVVVLSHYYMPAELQHTVEEGGFVDFVGDSLALSMEAAKAKQKHILFCGVRFMAETALLVNPKKRVFMPAKDAGCSLAESICGKHIKELKQQYPGIPIMGYINTYAETKAELDICCTSRNAIKIAASLPGKQILFVPDYFMGQNLQLAIRKSLDKELILWNGQCDVHEQFKQALVNTDELDMNTEVLFHWEVPAQTTSHILSKRKGVVGSTLDILNYVRESNASQFYLASECDLALSLQKQNKEKEFITPCLHCAYMKQNNLALALAAMRAIGSNQALQFEVKLDSGLIERARIPVIKMLAQS